MNAPPKDRAQAQLTIDLRALARNWRALSARAAPARCGAVIKADAYGIGLERAVVALSAAGCDTFFVAQADEALRARIALAPTARRASIFVLNGLAGLAGAAHACAQAGATPVIGSYWDLEIWSAEAKRRRRGRLPLAVMIDTGMNRLGFDWRAPQELAARIAADRALELGLVASHFIASDHPDDPHNAVQTARFETARAAFPGVAASLANSSGMFLPAPPCFDLTRPGYALYGGNPCPNAANPMEPVVRLRARILQLREIEAGESVGYDGQWTAHRRSRLAAIGVGYADGLPRNAMATDDKPGGEALVAGLRCPFAGRISMDLTVIDVTDVPTERLVPGLEAELLGDAITVDDLGRRAQTIGYEILTNLGRRYARDYVDD